MQTRPFARFGLLAMLGLLAAVAISVAQPAGASAAFASGQQEAWPVTWGEANGDLLNPVMFGTDPVDGSVYIGNEAETFETERIEKFSPTGTFEGAAIAPLFPTGLFGIAVDHQRKHIYAVQTDENWEHPENILTYSTEAENEELESEGVVALTSEAREGVRFVKEIAVEPTNGDLLINGVDQENHAVIEEVDPETGALVSRFDDALRVLNAERLGMAVAGDGVIYFVTTGEGQGSQSEIRAYTLPADFGSGSTPTPVPGFEAATGTEKWPVGSRLILEGNEGNGPIGHGPQVAVASAPDGSAETLYFKTEDFFIQPSQPGNFIVHGFSLPEEATSALYGGGEVEGQCAIQTISAALGVGSDGSLLVLDQGEFVEGRLPSFGPSVLRFGPEAAVPCPVPAGSIAMTRGGAPVTTVPQDRTVNLSAAGSELAGRTFEGASWTIEAPDGDVSTASGETVNHLFSEEGEYTIRMKLKTIAPEGAIGLFGNTVMAQPRKLIVSGPAPAEPAPTITSFTPAKGPVQTPITITGDEFTFVHTVEFGDTPVDCPSVACTITDDEHLTVDAPEGVAAGSMVKLTVANDGGSATSSEEFEYEPIPTIDSFTPTHGPAGTALSIVGSHFTFADKVEFGSTAVSCPGPECTITDGEHITVDAPEGIASGTKVKLTVANTDGASLPASEEFEFEGEPAIFSLTPTKALAGAAVAIFGDEFTNATEVDFGTTAIACPGPDCTIVDGEDISVHAPAGFAPGTRVPVTVTNGVGTATAGEEFEFELVEEHHTEKPAEEQKSSPPAEGQKTTTPPAETPKTETPKAETPKGGAAGRPKAPTPAQKRKEALKKCQKLHGKAKAICVKKAGAIGKKPAKKKPAKKHHG
jgi:hypothetical protein